MAAFNAKDAAKVALLYTDDAVVMPPNHALVKGRANIEAYFKQEFQLGVTNLDSCARWSQRLRALKPLKQGLR